MYLFLWLPDPQLQHTGSLAAASGISSHSGVEPRPPALAEGVLALDHQGGLPWGLNLDLVAFKIRVFFASVHPSDMIKDAILFKIIFPSIENLLCAKHCVKCIISF